MNCNAIEINGICKTYPGFALQDIHLTLPSGSVLGLVGANGAGKTTLIKLLMHAISPEAGRITILGMDVQSPAFTQVRQEIGVVLDEAYFPTVMTGKAVDRMMKSTYRNWDSQRYFDLLRRFSLPDNKAFQNFSRGMKMKLAMAVALAHDPKLLVLDEATSGLDPMARDEMLDLLREFTCREDHSILLSSHIVSDLEKICDYIAFLREGKLVLCQEKDQLLQDYALLSISRADLEAIPPEAVLGKRESLYSVQVLVRRRDVSDVFPSQHTSLEDIILFMSKEGQK